MGATVTEKDVVDVPTCSQPTSETENATTDSHNAAQHASESQACYTALVNEQFSGSGWASCCHPQAELHRADGREES